MTTRLESYMAQMLAGGSSPYSGFLGAYNMGVWGVSVSGLPRLEQGLMASGELLTTAPRRESIDFQKPRARNFVKYHDTPDLWGFGDGRGATKTWSQVARTSDVQHEMDEKRAWTKLVDRWRIVITQSRYLVDITSLSPPIPRDEVQVSLCKGIHDCLWNWVRAAEDSPQTAPALMIRLLFGNTFAGGGSYWADFQSRLEQAIAPLTARIADSRAATKPVVLYGSDVYKSGNVKPTTFNHSKIVAGDGQYALVGGHNMCEEVSSNSAPVIHDVTAEVTGPGAMTANAFAASLWLKAAESGSLYIYKLDWGTKKFVDLTKDSTKKWAPKNWYSYNLGTQTEVPNVLKNQYWYYPLQDLPATASVAPPDGSVPAAAIMGIGRWGDNWSFGLNCSGGLQLNASIPTEHACQYASDYLKRMMIADPANTVIRMCQQDLVNAGPFGGYQPSAHTICEALGKRLRATGKGTAIQVVVSSRFTQNKDGLAYSYGDGPREAIERISDTINNVVQASSNVKALRPGLAALGLSQALEDAHVYAIPSSSESSFCTVAPLAFCEARGATRNRGGYVWPDAVYVKQTGLGPSYTNARFRNEADDLEMKFGPGNHAKVMLVSTGADDATGLLMIGSDNMYPSPLAEFNFVIEGAEAIALFRAQYWDKLWRYSARLGFTVKPDGIVE